VKWVLEIGVVNPQQYVAHEAARAGKVDLLEYLNNTEFFGCESGRKTGLIVLAGGVEVAQWI
jgi:hypothetical protein